MYLQKWAQSSQIFVGHIMAPKRAPTMKGACGRLSLEKAATISVILEVLLPI